MSYPVNKSTISANVTRFQSSEDLNALVRRHIQSTVSSTPSKALATLEHAASDLIASGMVTLNAKLSGIEEEKLLHRVVEVWGFFWDQVLPYLEGVCVHSLLPRVPISKAAQILGSASPPKRWNVIIACSHAKSTQTHLPGARTERDPYHLA